MGGDDRSVLQHIPQSGGMPSGFFNMFLQREGLQDPYIEHQLMK